MIFDDLVQVARSFDGKESLSLQEFMDMAKSTIDGSLTYAEEKYLKSIWSRQGRFLLSASLESRYKVARTHYVVHDSSNAFYALRHTIINNWDYDFYWSWYGKAYALSNKFWFHGEVEEKTYPLYINDPDTSPQRVGEVKRVIQRLKKYKDYAIYGVYYLIDNTRVTLFDIKYGAPYAFTIELFDDHYSLISRETFKNKKAIYVFDEPGVYKKFKFDNHIKKSSELKKI